MVGILSVRGWRSALLMLCVVTLVWLLIIAGLGLLSGGAGIWSRMLALEPGMAESVLGNFPEVIVGVLGITITVVSITLQLAATRYTHRVTEMFFHDRGNLAVLAFYVVASVHCVIAAILVRNGIVPQLLLTSTLLVVVVTVLLLVPYFIYVFAFLDPARLVTHLKHEAVSIFLHSRAERDPRQLRRLQLAFRGAVEQLSDVALHALSQQDRGIASMTSDALRDIATTYVGHKSGMEEEWFKIKGQVRQCAEFEILSEESVERLEHNRSWLEWMVLRQMFTIYQASLNRMRDVVRLVSINVRQVSELALREKDEAVTDLCIRYFNSFLRSAINRKDVRSAYNVLDQYRNFAESALEDGARRVVDGVTQHLAYYGRLANHSGLPFVTETAAFDLASLCELAYLRAYDGHKSILERLLKVDEQPESKAEENSLRGVRKAQIKLACFYLSAGADDLARIIAHDMADEDLERLKRLRGELLAAVEPEFWEVVDRGRNFDYLPPDQREQIEHFYRMLAISGDVPAPADQ